MSVDNLTSFGLGAIAACLLLAGFSLISAATRFTGSKTRVIDDGQELL